MDLERVTNRSLGGREICRLCFSIDGGAGILLVGENIFDRLNRPFLLAGWCGNLEGFQFLLDPHDTPALLIPIKDLQDYSGLSDVEDEAFLLITIISIAPSRECRGVRIHGTSSQAPLDVLALVLTLGLGYARMECKQQLPCLAEEVYLLIVEKDIHLQFLEPPERHQKIHTVASEAADGLGIDHVDLARLTVGQEALEARTGADGPS